MKEMMKGEATAGGLTRNELIAIINMTYDAVNMSKAGPIFEDNEDGSRVLQSVGYNTYLYAIQKIIPMAAHFQCEEVKGE